jgi:hypothetical protein
MKWFETLELLNYVKMRFELLGLSFKITDYMETREIEKMDLSNKQPATLKVKSVREGPVQ